MRDPADLLRQLQKIADTMEVVEDHFSAEARMNAALHMATSVRPAPLAAAVITARDDLNALIGEIEDEIAAG